jgi:hypothetical protein
VEQVENLLHLCGFPQFIAAATPGYYLHPTAKGAEIVGTLLYDTLMRAYEKHATCFPR